MEFVLRFLDALREENVTDYQNLFKQSLGDEKAKESLKRSV